MLAVFFSILCAITMYLTWRLEKTVRRVDWLENELYATQVELENLRSDVEDIKYR